MLYKNEDSPYPSIVVKDGETATLSGAPGQVTGVPVIAMRPLTTAALWLMAGKDPPGTPRLSDRTHFEEIDCTDGFVNLAYADEEGRVDGYSAPFLRSVIDALDPEARVPERVRRLIPPEGTQYGCKCRTAREAPDPALAEAAALRAGYSVRETFVPEFLVQLNLFSYVTRLGDIIVGRNSTLILDSDLMFAWAGDCLAYRGARIIQQAPFLALNLTGTMRGSLTFTFHDLVSDTLKIDREILGREPATKP
jgi:hypothetical protein